MTSERPQVQWTDDDGQPQRAPWVSPAGHPPPRRVQVVDDSLGADAAFQLAQAGTGLLWVGDFHNARMLLQALGRRLESRARRTPPPAGPGQAFEAQRRAQAERARVLGMVLLPFEADHRVPLRRAPEVRAAVAQAVGPMDSHYVASLRELQGLVGAFEWRKKGVEVPALGAGARIHPHHGVFSPVRGEYVELVARAPLPAAAQAAGAFDIGTGTGVLSAVLARRGVRPVLATDLAPQALACARENLERLGLADAVQVLAADLYPEGRAGLVLCNPPWVPAPKGTPLEAAVYDPDSRMLRGWLAGLAAHLVPGGEGWLILSDLAEHLGLRTRAELLRWVGEAGLQVLGRLDTRPTHRRAADAEDPLHAARAAELTSLWRLGVAVRPEQPARDARPQDVQRLAAPAPAAPRARPAR
ncbi:MAG: class I SAM-dependent methyltransferase, partial [Burkholderiales bacterium]|nr:class I SAM-dependent methyltransferase [Burkholderiales bacterium]